MLNKEEAQEETYRQYIRDYQYFMEFGFDQRYHDDDFKRHIREEYGIAVLYFRTKTINSILNG
jgi:hypothetical protein